MKIKEAIMEECYTQEEIEELWKQYNIMYMYRVLKNGKTYIRKQPATVGEEGVSDCQMDKASKLISFPKFLEMVE